MNDNNKSVGRKPSENPRTKRVKISYTPQEYKKAISIYNKVNVSPNLKFAEYLREKSLEKKPDLIVKKQMYLDIIKSINRVGANINQISHQLNIRTNKIFHKDLIDSFNELSYQLEEIKKETRKKI